MHSGDIWAPKAQAGANARANATNWHFGKSAVVATYHGVGRPNFFVSSYFLKMYHGTKYKIVEAHRRWAVKTGVAFAGICPSVLVTPHYCKIIV